MNTTRKIYGLIGYPLGHSFSSRYFNDKFAAEGIDAEYINFEIPAIEDIRQVLSRPGLSGLNVTIPYKEKVIPFLDALSPEAKAIGAVNVIRIDRSGKGGSRLTLTGHNSDVVGFRNSLRPLLTPERNRALVLGTGGAAKAVFHGLKSLGVEPVYVSRTPREGILTYSDLTPEVMASHKVIVNTTPLGMSPRIETCPDIPYSLLTSGHLLYDLVYNPDVTTFMKRGTEHGAEVKNGLEMLLLQAFEAWRIWNE